MLPSPKINLTVPLSSEEKGNQLFPIFIKLNQLRTVLIGGGNVGLEKLTAILANSQQADVKLVALDIHPKIIELASSYPNLKIDQKSYEADDLANVDIVFAATNDQQLNEAIKADAHQKGLLINVADKPGLCDFYLGAIVQKGDLKIAISTNGKSPTIAKRLKEILNEGIPAELDDTLQNMSALRQTLKGDFAFKVKKLN
eukprot:Opistho-1_new@101264